MELHPRTHVTKKRKLFLRRPYVARHERRGRVGLRRVAGGERTGRVVRCRGLQAAVGVVVATVVRRWRRDDRFADDDGRVFMRRGRDAQYVVLDCAERAVGGLESSESSSPLAPWPVAALDADAVVVGCSTLGRSVRLSRVVGRVRVRGPDVADDSLRRELLPVVRFPGIGTCRLTVEFPTGFRQRLGGSAAAGAADSGFRHGETRRARNRREREVEVLSERGRIGCMDVRRPPAGAAGSGSARRLDGQRAAGTDGGRGHRPV